MHDGGVARVEAIGFDPDTVVTDAIGRVERVDTLADEVVPVTEAALIAIADKQSSWRPAELARVAAAATPTTIATQISGVFLVAPAPG